MTEAVLVALRERLARERNTPERIRASGPEAIHGDRSARSRLEYRRSSVTKDVDDDLYDERGLPK